MNVRLKAWAYFVMTILLLSLSGLLATGGGEEVQKGQNTCLKLVDLYQSESAIIIVVKDVCDVPIKITSVTIGEVVYRQGVVIKPNEMGILTLRGIKGGPKSIIIRGIADDEAVVLIIRRGVQPPFP